MDADVNLRPALPPAVDPVHELPEPDHWGRRLLRAFPVDCAGEDQDGIAKPVHVAANSARSLNFAISSTRPYSLLG
jgi:hypothetical protein